MGVTGKYDFKGIKKVGARGISAALATTPYTAWLASRGFAPLTNYLFEALCNWLANKGLIVLNIGVMVVETEFDQRAFDSALDEALLEIELAKKEYLSPEEIKKIDEKVKIAFRRFAIVPKHN